MILFTKTETKWVTGILIFILSITLVNFKISFKKSRDTQRKSDIRAITNALGHYGEDFASFPFATEGKIQACVDSQTEAEIERILAEGKTLLEEEYEPALIACEWGHDLIKDVTDPDYPAYLIALPLDPRTGDGFSYLYLSNGKRFQVYASLESANQDEYDLDIVKRKLMCGEKICNFGLSNGVALDISIEAYENELLELNEI